MKPLTTSQAIERSVAAYAYLAEAQSKGLQEFLGYLYTRWEDEKDYESPTEYRKAIKNFYKKAKISGKVLQFIGKSPYNFIADLGIVASAQLRVKFTVDRRGIFQAWGQGNTRGEKSFATCEGF